jgi:hypothetical protein
LQRRSVLARQSFIVLLGLLFCASGAWAIAQNVRFDEIVAGSFGRQDVQYVELRANLCFSDPWANAVRLAFFDGTGTEVGQFVFPSDPPFNCSNLDTPILLATPAYLDLATGPAPDFVIPPLLAPGSGKVCFQDLPAGSSPGVCLAYGIPSGSGAQDVGPALPSTGVCALRRLASDGLPPGPLFGQEFDLAVPAPLNSSLQNIPFRARSSFNDVPMNSAFLRFIEALLGAGVTGGCGNGAFCPGNAVTREQMAVFLLLAKEGPTFQPPACTAQVFDDVPCSNPFARWINELAARGISGGCGDGNFCPGSAVTREQMAVFLLLTREGAAFAPPACTVQAFNDVPCASPFAPWVNELAVRGISGGCGGGGFCPGRAVTREQMAVFLSAAFDLPVPSNTCPGGAEDDHGNTPSTATPATPGVPIPGALEVRADQDIFSLVVNAGETFMVELEGTTSPFNVVLEALAADGFTALAAGDNQGGGPDTALFVTAPETGVILLRVRERTDSTGRYTLHVRGPLVDDHGGAANPTPLAPGVPVEGDLLEGDTDVFSFSAQAGQVFLIEARGRHAGASLIVEALDLNGIRVLAAATGSGFTPAQIGFQAPVSGTFFARVRPRSQPSSYTVSIEGPLTDDHGDTAAQATSLAGLTEAAGRLEVPDDVDFFSFPATAGDVFAIQAADLHGFSPSVEVWAPDGVTQLRSNPSVEPLFFRVPSDGTFFASVRSLPLGRGMAGTYRMIAVPLIDDHGNRPADATVLIPGAPGLLAEIQPENDVDYYAFDAVPGQIFWLKVNTFDSVSLRLQLFDSDGTTPLESPIPSSSYWWFFQAPHAGRFYLRVEISASDPFDPDPPVYGVVLSLPVADDHGDTADTATLLPVDGPAVNGENEIQNDFDVFAFDATAGESLTVETDQLGPGSDTVLELLDRDGITVLASDDDDGPGLGSRIVLAVPATGRYFARVSQLPFGFGSYAITVRRNL